MKKLIMLLGVISSVTACQPELTKEERMEYSKKQTTGTRKVLERLQTETRKRSK